MNAGTFVQDRTPFLMWLADWYARLKAVPFAAAVGDAKRTAVLSVDLIEGFAHEGPLSSPRVAGIVPATTRLFQQAGAAGVRHFVLTQDCHTEDAPEFSSFGRHCSCDSKEAQTVAELLALPISDRFVIMRKNSISSSLGTALDAWLNTHHRDVDTFLVVGDCTDLCTYQLAMYLRLRANAHSYHQRVIVPADCVETFDLPVNTATTPGALPHDGDLMHTLFLYHMALNGVEVYASITAA
jgi:nicotinamidase-related amidase